MLKEKPSPLGKEIAKRCERTLGPEPQLREAGEQPPPQSPRPDAGQGPRALRSPSPCPHPGEPNFAFRRCCSARKAPRHGGRVVLLFAFFFFFFPLSLPSSLPRKSSEIETAERWRRGLVPGLWCWWGRAETPQAPCTPWGNVAEPRCLWSPHPWVHHC